MILYRLSCSNDHEFEAWFKSGRAFDTQSARGVVSCPLCGDTSVTKAVMAPNLGRSCRAPLSESASDPADLSPAEPPPDAAQVARQELTKAVRRLRQEIAEKAEYVGPRFADEARRIESGEVANRGIYGEATLNEARALLEDGIAVLPLPRAPEDHN